MQTSTCMGKECATGSGTGVEERRGASGIVRLYLKQNKIQNERGRNISLSEAHVDFNHVGNPHSVQQSSLGFLSIQ